MNRKDFFKKAIISASSLSVVPLVLSSCQEETSDADTTPVKKDPNACAGTPSEIKGPFPNKTPAEMVKENIVGNRSGIPLLITIKVEDTSSNCEALAGVVVDLWHCDAKGNYSEYSGQIEGDFTSEHFLRGRQTTNSDGEASFISIYPGWYPGRAPHLHLEIKNSEGKSLLVTQTAFPEDVSNTIYSTNDYNGDFDTSNAMDGAFRDGVELNMATSITGNTTDGYSMIATIRV